MDRVYFCEHKVSEKISYTKKLEELISKLEIEKNIKKGSYCAIKVHMGEYGNSAFVPPWYIKKIADLIKKYGGKPFVTDTNVLYRGNRTNAIDHLMSVSQHGYNEATLGVPVIIADGLLGNSGEKIKIDGKILKEVEVAEVLCQADVIVNSSHFKGHLLTGFGGALKNLGMGGATRAGKLEMHSYVKPYVVEKNCTACGRCIRYCPVNAIKIETKKAHINKEICIGCADCIAVCEYDAVHFDFDAQSEDVQRKMMEYFSALHKEKKDNIYHINFLMNVTQFCDCFNFSGKPVSKDVGILASKDPVAIDKASIDLLNKETGNDIFKELFPEIDYNIQLKHAVELGIGSLEYKLEEIKLD